MGNMGLLGTMSRYGGQAQQQPVGYGSSGGSTYSGPTSAPPPGPPQAQGRYGLLGSGMSRLQGVGQAGGQINPAYFAARGGVQAPVYQGQNSVQRAQQGPSLDQIQAEMARRNVGAQLNADPRNSALAGYMMGQ